MKNGDTKVFSGTYLNFRTRLVQDSLKATFLVHYRLLSNYTTASFLYFKTNA